MPYDSESEEWLQASSAPFFIADISTPRNYQFHKKYFALLNIAYKHWEPETQDTKYGAPEKNFDRFRDEITIMSGYYTVAATINGDVRLIPKSISFAKMDEETFQAYYSKVIDVILKKVLIGWTIEQVDQQIGTFL